jgi:serine protease Do
MLRGVSRRAAFARVLLVVVVASMTAGATMAPAQSQAAPPAMALPESYPWIRLAEALTPAVVNVRVVAEPARGRDAAEESLPEPFRRFAPERGPRAVRGMGSGFIVDASGYVVTNHHVVNEAKSIEVTLSDGRQLPAKLIGSDPDTDLALLKVEATGLPTIPLGRSGEVRVGEPVMAIGNPFGLDHTVTVGIISAKSRVIGAGRYDDFLQTDAAINPGNSGGPLISTRGEAIGIASAIASRSGGFQGIGFAIPSDLARPVLAELRTAGRVTRGWLGVSIQPLTPELVRSFGLAREEGALVASVIEDSPAARAGLKPGDVVTRYDGRPVDGPRALSTLVAGTAVGRTVELAIIRDGQPRSLSVTIANLAQARSASAPAEGRVAGRLGLELQELTPELAQRIGVKPGKGVVVTEVRPGSPAARAGLAEGDVIREVNRKPVQAPGDVDQGLSRSGSGADQVLLRIERQGASRYVVVEAS